MSIPNDGQYARLREHLKASEQVKIRQGVPYEPGGWDGDFFYPYTDPAGWETIGYGRKIPEEDIASGKYQDGIGMTEALNLLDEDMHQKGIDVARSAYGEDRRRSWTDLTEGERSYLSDLHYQAGATDSSGELIWRAAMDAIDNEDHTVFKNRDDIDSVLGLSKWRDPNGDLIPDWSRWTRRQALLENQETTIPGIEDPDGGKKEVAEKSLELVDPESAVLGSLLAPGSSTTAYPGRELGTRNANFDLNAKELMAIGFEKENSVYALKKLAKWKADRADIPELAVEKNWVKEAIGTPIMDYEDAIKQLAFVRTQADFDDILSAIKNEEARNLFLSSNGMSGVLGLVGGALFDPVNLAPLSIFRKANFAKRIMGGAVAGGASSALAEIPLSYEQYTRTNLESALNIGAGSVLTGLFSGVLGRSASMRQYELADILDKMDADMSGMDNLGAVLSAVEQNSPEQLLAHNFASSIFEHFDISGQSAGSGKIASVIEEASEALAKREINIEEAKELIRERLNALSKSGEISIKPAISQLEQARRESDAPLVDSSNPRYATSTEDTQRLDVRGENTDTNIVGYVSHADGEIPIRINEDGSVTLHLDTPMSLKDLDPSQTRVTGIWINLPLERMDGISGHGYSRQDIFDPNMLLIRSPRELDRIDVDWDLERLNRVSRRMQEDPNANLDTILKEEGYIGRVQGVGDSRFKTRELILFEGHEDLISSGRRNISLEEVRGNTIDDIYQIDQKLGVARTDIAGGSVDFMHRFNIEDESGSVVLPDDAAFDSMNNPWGVLYGSGPAEVQLKTNRFLESTPVKWTLKSMFPIYRLLASKNNATKKIALRLFDNAGLVMESDTFMRKPLSIETQIKRWNRHLAMASRKQLEAFIKYKMRIAGKDVSDLGKKSPTLGAIQEQILDVVKSQRGMNYDEFRQRVGVAGRYGDKDNPLKYRETLDSPINATGTEDVPIPEIGEAAKALRDNLFDPMFKEMLDLNLVDFDELLRAGIQAESYMTRLYNRQKIKANSHQFVEEIANHYMERDPHMSLNVAREWAIDIKNTILHAPEQRMVYEFQQTSGVPRSQRARSRTIDIPDEVLLKWLENDSDLLTRMYTRTLAPDIELAKFMKVFGREEILAKRLKAVGNNRPRFERLLKQEDNEIKRIRSLLTEYRNKRAAGGNIGNLERSLNASFKRMNKVYKAFDEEDLVTRTPPQGELGNVDRNAVANQDAGTPEWKSLLTEYRINALEDEIARLDVIGKERPDLKSMEMMWKPIEAEYNRMIALSDQETATKLADDFEKEKETIIGLIHLLRGDYRHPWDSAVPATGFQRSLRALRRYNVLTMSGSFLISSFSDAARLVTNHGFYESYKDLIIPFAKGTSNLNVSIQDARDMGVAIEVMLNNRMSLLSELGDYAGQYTKAESLLERGADAAFLINLMSPWNDVMKGTVSYLSTLRILRVGKAISERGDVDPQTLLRLHQIGIDEELAVRMYRQSEQFGTDELLDGFKMPNQDAWDDLVAKETFLSALQQEADNLIITPGVGDKPFLMSNEIAKTLFQFQSFAFSATLRIGVSSLQTSDKFVAQAIASSIALGMLSYVFKMYQYGRTPSSDPRVLLLEGIDRSGLLGILMQADNVLMGMTGDRIGMGPMLGVGKPSKWAAQRRIERTFFGPSFGRISELGEIGDALFGGDFKGRHAKYIRNLLPWQNLFYTEMANDAIQESMARYFNEN